ncbi:beta-lactamase-like protein [Aspergillus heterothallicus]
MALPAPSTAVNLYLLNGGSMTAEHHILHAGEAPGSEFRMYNWCFLIHHAQKKRWVLWDLGMSANPEDFPPVIANGILKEARVLDPVEPLQEQIKRRAGIEPHQLDTIILSHAHFDHARPIRTTFPNATIYFGPGTSSFCSPGHLTNPLSPWDGRFFDADPAKATETWATLSGPWVPFGPFEAAMDFFGDGGLWVVRAPGHMPGNLCGVVRVGFEGEGAWVVLGSDCCHSRDLLNGTKSFGTFPLPDGSMTCLHADPDAARDTLAKLRVLERDMGAHVALAHDASWMVEGGDEVLMSLLDERFRADVKEAVVKGEPF